MNKIKLESKKQISNKSIRYSYFIKYYEFLNNYNLTTADKIIFGVIVNLKSKTNTGITTKKIASYSNFSTRQINFSLINLNKNELIEYDNYKGINRIVINEKLVNKELSKNDNFIPIYATILMNNNFPSPNYKVVYSFIRLISKQTSKNIFTCVLFKKDICKICGISESCYNSIIKFLSDNNYINLKKSSKNCKKNSQVFADIINDLWPIRRQKIDINF